MKLHPVRFSLLFCALFMAFWSWQHRWKGEDGYGWEAVVDGDAKGYYAPLPALLLFQDPSFSNYTQPGNESIARYYHERFRVNTNQGTVHKNYIGVALMQLPFFAAGHLLASFCNEPVNGYSWPYMFMLLLGSLFYCVLGLYFTARLIGSYDISPPATAILLLLLSVGTNLLYYTAIHAAMPHVYSFFLLAAFCWFLRKLFIQAGARNMFLSATLLGLLILVRPVNAMVVLAVPFLAGSLFRLRHGFAMIARRPASFLLSGLLLLTVVGLQLAFYKLQTGHWWVWSYGDEGFRFNDPHIADVLFSWKKGLFIYTPVMLFSLFGMVLLFRESKWLGVTYLFFISVTVYVISSWWSWFYGDGYGLRAFVDFYPLMAIPAALLLDQILMLKSPVRFLLLLPLPLLLLLSVIQNYQYRYRIIHPAEMNFEKYRYIFLKTGAQYRDVIGGDNEYVYPRLSDKPVAVWMNDFEEAHDHWYDVKLVTADGALSGSHVFRSSGDLYGAAFSISGKQLPLPSGKLFAVVRYQRRELEQGACDQSYLACAVSNGGASDKSWKAFRMNEFPQDQINVWRPTEHRFRLPENIGPDEMLHLYFWSKEKKSFEVDDVSVEMFELGN